MPTASFVEDDRAESPTKRVALVLCFDGTGNKFSGNESDTNIVKIYSMLEKHTKGQYHYYQPGIGTYTQNQSSGSNGIQLFSGIRSGIWSAADEGLGLTFVDHVLAGYQFLMRYYQEHNDIYIFGFSRGAYTARFLAEMIWKIGLLSKGNEEMVHFAWETFSKFQSTRGDNPNEKNEEEVYMDNFRNTFSRPHIKVHFLGLFDCVNSVGQFEVPLFRNSFQYIAQPAAKHIRHAVSIHERRLKFKPALFLFDPKDLENKEGGPNVDLKEVWFGGNHADVGGGWGYEGRGLPKSFEAPDDTRWTDNKRHLLSDTPLNWMLQEVLTLPNSGSTLKFNEEELKGRNDAEKIFLNPNALLNATAVEDRDKSSIPHDMLKFHHGAQWYMVLVWWLIESWPFFSRLELEGGKWVPRHWPPNLGAPRDLPSNARIHSSVKTMVKAGLIEMPKTGGDNSHFTNTRGIFARWFGFGGNKTQEQAPTPEPAIDWVDDETAPLLPKDTKDTKDTKGKKGKKGKAVTNGDGENGDFGI